MGLGWARLLEIKIYTYLKNWMCYKNIITFFKSASKILLGALIAITV